MYGLGAGVWTRDGSRAFRMGRGIKAGRVWTNCYHLYPAGAAFGGYKSSGVGRENHKMMLDHYTQTKNLLGQLRPEAARLLLGRDDRSRRPPPPRAAEAVRALAAAHGPLVFHLSGGCCDGSSPMCLLASRAAARARRHAARRGRGRAVLHRRRAGPPLGPSALLLDVLPGAATSLSLEGAEDLHFVTRRADPTPDETQSHRADCGLERIRAAPRRYLA